MKQTRKKHRPAFKANVNLFVYSSLEDLNDTLASFVRYYNYQRYRRP